MRRILPVILVFALTLVQCRKDRNSGDDVSGDTSIKLEFSGGSVLFDTIFTTVGSTTRWLTVYNRSDRAIRISSISLKGPDNAFFRMNVDGEAGTAIKDVYLAGKDSLFIFIDVTIDPNLGNALPFLVEGDIEFITNGNVQNVKLLAYGRQAYFITPDRFPENIPPYHIVMKGIGADTTWNNSLPIVIYGYAVVDSTQHLTIEKGTQLYFHANSGLWIYRYGQITVNGTLDEPVVFQGDRLDDYKDIPGSWDRIWINEGSANADNVFNHAIIKNSFIGIQAEFNPFQGLKTGWSQNKIVLYNTIIDNTRFAGIYGINHNVLGLNSLISNSGECNLLISGGGAHLYRHCTFANYYRDHVRNSPAVYLSHLYYDASEQAYRMDSMVVDFENCIVYGDHESEFGIEDETDPGDNINFTFHNSLLKSDIDHSTYGSYADTVFNPGNSNIFADPYGDDFSPAPSSPARPRSDNPADRPAD